MICQGALSNDDLLFAGGFVSVRSELLAAVGAPGGVGELEASGVTVAGIDVPVPAGLALGQAVPVNTGIVIA